YTSAIELYTLSLHDALPIYHIQLLVFAVGAAVPHIQTGKVKALALTGPQRSKALPDIPTAAEAGYPQLNSGAWMGILVPAGTPRSEEHTSELQSRENLVCRL